MRGEALVRDVRQQFRAVDQQHALVVRRLGDRVALDGQQHAAASADLVAGDEQLTELLLVVERHDTLERRGIALDELVRAICCERDEQHLAGALDADRVDAAECVRQPLDSLEAAVGTEGADAVDEVPLGRGAQLQLADRSFSGQLEAQHRRAAHAVVCVVALGRHEHGSAFADRDPLGVGDPAAVCVPQLVRGGDLRIRAAVCELEHEQLARAVVHCVGAALLVEVDARDVAVEGAGRVSCDDLVESPRPWCAVDGLCLAGLDVRCVARRLAGDCELAGHVGDAAPRGGRVALP